jgi:hypothetical protein
MGKNCPHMGVFLLLIGKNFHIPGEEQGGVRSDGLTQGGAE